MKFLEVPSVQTIQRSPRLPKDSKMDKSLLIVNLSLGRPEEVPVSPGEVPLKARRGLDEVPGGPKCPNNLKKSHVATR